MGPISTFALPVIAMIAFWWEDWPGARLRPPLAGLTNTMLVAVSGVVLTVAGQVVVGHLDLRGVFDANAAGGHSPTFPATMPLSGAIFTVMLELTLVSEGWPLRRLGRFAGGVAALVAAWAIGLALYLALVEFRPPPGSELHARDGALTGAELGAILVCIGALQVGFSVVLRGWPFAGVASRAIRLACSNFVVIAGGSLSYLALASVAGLSPTTISAIAGPVVAAGLVVGMLFEGWLDSLLPAVAARVASVVAMAVVAVLLYLGLRAYADAVGWTRAEPADWVSYAGLNAIGIGVILHVAVGRRWPFIPTAETGGST